MYPASSVLIEEDAGPVASLVEHPTAADTDIQGNTELFGPTLAVKPLALLGRQVDYQRSTAIPARMAGPSLAGNVGHYDR
jgi:hypothetical protein